MVRFKPDGTEPPLSIDLRNSEKFFDFVRSKTKVFIEQPCQPHEDSQWVMLREDLMTIHFDWFESYGLVWSLDFWYYYHKGPGTHGIIYLFENSNHAILFKLANGGR